MNKLVLLPSAKIVPLELQSEFGPIPSAMIPLDSRPAMHYIFDYYQKSGFELLVAVHEQSEEIYRYCDDHPDVPASIIDVDATNSIGETVLRALESIEKLPDCLVVNFADTCIGDEPPTGDFVCFSKQEDHFRWTTFELDNLSSFVTINERLTEKHLNGLSLNVFVGVFGISDVPLFIELLNSSVIECNKDELDPFYVTVRKYYNALSESQKTFHLVKDWWDFGHLDTYYATKKQISLNCRYFNRVKVDNRRGIIHKTSTNVRKLTDEIKWYLKLPKGLQYMAPRIFDYSLSFDAPYIDLEFYGYPALNDLYLYADYDIGVWTQIFMAIGSTLADMGAYRLVPEEKGELLEAMTEMYEKKTVSRLDSILDDKRFAFFFSDRLTVNGKNVIGLKRALELLPKVIQKIDLYDPKWFSIIHGDLCLSNILYDNRNRIARFIDPRGGFGKYDIYGDPRYDIAKLSHSIEGDYDFLVNGLFDLELIEGDMQLNVHYQDRHKTIKALFREKILGKWEVNYLQMKMIESLLFLSMVPLHADRYLSQQAFICRGLEIFTEIVKQSGMSEV